MSTVTSLVKILQTKLLIIISGKTNMQGENIEWWKIQHETMVMMHIYIICNGMKRTHLYFFK